MEFKKIPHVRAENRIELERLKAGFFLLSVWYGFMDRPNVQSALRIVQNNYMKIDLENTTFFVGHETLIPGTSGGMSRWRDRLYILMERNSEKIVRYFNIPNDRVFEIGAHIKL